MREVSPKQTRATLAIMVAIWSVSFMFMTGLSRHDQLGASDFGQYYVTSRRVIVGAPTYDPIDYAALSHGGQSPSVGLRESHRMPNPAPFVLMLLPLGFLSLSMAWWITFFSTLLLVALISYRTAQELRSEPLERWTWVAVSVGSFPVLVQGVLNHAEMLVWAAVVWGWLRLRTGDERRAGVLFGLAGCLKLFPLAIIPMLVAARYRTAGVFAFMTAALGFILSVAVLGSDSALVFIYEVLPQAARFRFSLGNISALSLLARIMPIEPAVIVGALFLLLTIYLCRRHRSADQVFVLAVTTSLLCSPLSWTYYLTLVLPCVMVSTTWLRGVHRWERAILPLLLATLVYWPGILGGWSGLDGLPLPLKLAINYVPTIGLLVLWRIAQHETVASNLAGQTTPLAQEG